MRNRKKLWRTLCTIQIKKVQTKDLIQTIKIFKIRKKERLKTKDKTNINFQKQIKALTTWTNPMTKNKKEQRQLNPNKKKIEKHHNL